LADKFYFVPKKDHGGSDIMFKRMPLEKMMEEALRLEMCEGFNTLGFFKSRVDKLEDSVYFGDNDGLYIKKTVEISDYVPTIDIDEGLSRKNYCFIHSCTLEKDETGILDRLVEKVAEFRSVFEKVYILNIGYEIDTNKYGSEYTIKNVSENPKLYELETLNIILTFSKKTRDSNVLYLHTKGILHSKDAARTRNVEDWKNMMLFHLLNKHKQCTDLLNKYDSVGCNLHVNMPHPDHYSGNYWWATTNHIQKLKYITQFNDIFKNSSKIKIATICGRYYGNANRKFFFEIVCKRDE
jgi:hypothetical protein